MKKTIEIRYKIYQVTQDGLLKHPESHWGYSGTMFNTYGYATQDEAMQAILEAEYPLENLLIVSSASIGWGD